MEAKVSEKNGRICQSAKSSKGGGPNQTRKSRPETSGGGACAPVVKKDLIQKEEKNGIPMRKIKTHLYQEIKRRTRSKQPEPSENKKPYVTRPERKHSFLSWTGAQEGIGKPVKTFVRVPSEMEPERESYFRAETNLREIGKGRMRGVYRERNQAESHGEGCHAMLAGRCNNGIWGRAQVEPDRERNRKVRELEKTWNQTAR